MFLPIDTKLSRSSHQRCSVKKGVLKNFAKFTGKHLCWSLQHNLKPATLLQKSLQHRCFPMNFTKKLLETSFFNENLWWTVIFKLAKNIFKEHFRVSASNCRIVITESTQLFVLVLTHFVPIYFSVCHF